MKIAMIGSGYVGLVSGACFADFGHDVVCVDKDESKIARLHANIMPIYEPGLDALVKTNVDAGRLSFSTNVTEAVKGCDAVFIAVGTPPAEDGSADLAHVLTVARSIGRHMQDYKVVVDKSTVPVGTADRVRQEIAQALREREAIVPYAVVSNPEFLKEGAAIADFMHPDRVVIGADDEQATLLMRALYAPFLRNRDRVLVMDTRSAELTKYVANAMLASRISFMNEMSRLAERVGADIEQVRMGIGADPRIGTHFLYAGCGWGGSCFPKDVQALSRMGQDVGLDLDIVQAVREVNDQQKRILGERIRHRYGDDLQGLTFAVWGLSFKPDTDDLREAPSLLLIDELLQHGSTVRAFDPVAMPALAALWPSRPGLVLCTDPLSAAEGASALAVVTEWREFRSPDFGELKARMKTPVILDGRNLYDPGLMLQLGFEHLGMGRGSVGARWARLPESRLQALAA